MTLENNVYDSIRGYVKENHGWNGEELAKSKEFKDYQDFQNKLKGFDGQKVKISFIAHGDIFSSQGEKKGKIKFDCDNNGTARIKFFEGRKTSRHYILDGGLFDGFFAVLVPLKIESI